MAVTDAAGRPWTQAPSVDACGPWPAKRRILRTASDCADDLHFTTDQKVGGSSPSERARSKASSDHGMSRLQVHVQQQVQQSQQLLMPHQATFARFEVALLASTSAPAGSPGWGM